MIQRILHQTENLGRSALSSDGSSALAVIEAIWRLPRRSFDFSPSLAAFAR